MTASVAVALVLLSNLFKFQLHTCLETVFYVLNSRSLSPQASKVSNSTSRTGLQWQLVLSFLFRCIGYLHSSIPMLILSLDLDRALQNSKRERERVTELNARPPYFR